MAGPVHKRTSCPHFGGKPSDLCITSSCRRYHSSHGRRTDPRFAPASDLIRAHVKLFMQQSLSTSSSRITKRSACEATTSLMG
ncbi:hypothetical protein M407DRAFT_154388 [Tulasnella calospora MUT 4182]|uniref:Uncharacterized protein n=1 Tax=Tulasnella calospora MUT 4182 TaxID=1051891 RepID=A0A0C3Q5K9_9AGAM|nr:hypothetical protein M407DRAFT_154388 [Tulasnella calospora MUT 4182]